MKVYLAGKMDAEHGAWRDAVLSPRYDAKAKGEVPGWVLLRDADDPRWGTSDERCFVPWPRSENRLVCGLHEYVGPYRTDLVGSWEWKHYGEFHGSKVIGQHGGSNGEEDHLIVEACREAIAGADLFFAYINSPDCFGTLAEIGLARAHGVFTVVSVEEGSEWDWSDYWFVERLCDATVKAGEPIKVGTRPERPSSQREWHAPSSEWRAYEEDMRGYLDRRAAEHNRIVGMVKDAIVCWTARPERKAPVAMVRQAGPEQSHPALVESANAFALIARWSADPRVRDEAQRMLRRISG